MLEERDLQLLNDLLSRSPLAVVAWDSEFRISYWSTRAESMFGYSAADVIGKTVTNLSLVPAEDLESVVDVQRRIEEFDNVHSVVNVNKNIRADGEVRTCRWTIFAVQDDDRYHVLSYADDITDAVEAQSAIADTEERFRSLFEYNPDVTMIFSPDGRIVDVNHAVTRFGPVPREQIIGMHFSAFIEAEDVPKHEMYLQRALAGETIFYTARVHTLEGRPLEVSITTVPVHRRRKDRRGFLDHQG